jgi:hypothetical protein
MKIMIKTSLLAVAMVAGGCTLGSTDVNLGNHPMDPSIDPNTGLPTPPEGPAEPPQPPPRCDMGKQYVGFAGTMLEAGRIDNDLGLERARVKPYTALTGEYQRVLGNQPALVSTSGSTFGQDPNRWLSEPISSAVTVYSAYRVAFQGCLSVTTPTTATKYQSAPSNSTADQECRSWARKFWSRDATDLEAAACVQVAMVDSLKEVTSTTGGMPTTTTTTAPRRWAYTCASVLAAAGFMTY